MNRARLCSAKNGVLFAFAVGAMMFAGCASKVDLLRMSDGVWLDDARGRIVVELNEAGDVAALLAGDVYVSKLTKVEEALSQYPIEPNIGLVLASPCKPSVNTAITPPAVAEAPSVYRTLTIQWDSYDPGRMHVFAGRDNRKQLVLLLFNDQRPALSVVVLRTDDTELIAVSPSGNEVVTSSICIRTDAVIIRGNPRPLSPGPIPSTSVTE